MEHLARAGYTAKGGLYLIIGILAIQAALGSGGDTEGSRGAIHHIAQQPFGQILLGITMFGLVAYALWRFVQAGFDVEQQGSDASGLLKRGGYVLSGLLYLALGYEAATILFDWHLLGGGGGGNSEQAMTARVLSKPGGQWLIGIVGAGTIALGIYHFYKAATAKFMDQFKTSAMSGKERQWARRTGQFGIGARGVIFCMLGAFLIQAALQSQPSEARGLDGALQTLAGQPYGPWLLFIVAAGLAAYGLFCFTRARYRHFPV